MSISDNVTALVNHANAHALLVKGLDSTNLTADDLQTVFVSARRGVQLVRQAAKVANITLPDAPPAPPASN